MVYSIISIWTQEADPNVNVLLLMKPDMQDNSWTWYPAVWNLSHSMKGDYTFSAYAAPISAYVALAFFLVCRTCVSFVLLSQLMSHFRSTSLYFVIDSFTSIYLPSYTVHDPLITYS